MAAVEPFEVSLSTSPEALWARLREDWQVGWVKGEITPEAAIAWVNQVCDRRHYLESYRLESYRLESYRRENHSNDQTPPLVLIAESDPADCLAYFWAALLARWDVAIANPHWGLQEWQSVSEQLQPTVVWGQNKALPSLFATPERNAANPPASQGEPAILIPTGGSSGQVKFACHSWPSLIASVSGFCQYFAPQGEPINVCCVLPVYHVSGLMQVLRAWLSNGQVVITPFKRLSEQRQIEQRQINPPQNQAQGCRDFQGWFISLVPTQLERLLQANQGAWLRQFQAVLLGGAPPWPTLLARAANLHIPLCLSYGMTETAAMVTALAPAEFLQGRISSGRSLPHATLHIVKSCQPLSPSEPEVLPPGEIGHIVVRTAAVAQGYHGAHSPTTAFSSQLFCTDDLGYLSADGHLYITGRASHKIISGGENIFPAEVEAAIRSTGQVQDVCVLGLSDPHWGEAVVAAYVPINPSVCPQSLQQALIETTKDHPLSAPTARLSRYKHPKHWLPFLALPRNAQGKLNRQQLLAHLHQRLPQAPLSNPQAQRSVPDDGDRAS